jgi:hypothetical protein
MIDKHMHGGYISSEEGVRMAEHPHTITLTELEQAVAAAVKQVQQQKTLASPGRLIMGRWIDKAVAEAEAKHASEEITRQVTAKIPGLNATPFSISGHGGSTMGFVMREE